MAISWSYNPTEYQEQSFEIVPAGDHRVRITEVVEKTFRSGNEGYEITMEVSGHKSKLWFYLVFDSSDRQKTNQRIGDFFNSFGITDYDLNHYHNWVGKVGAVRVKHEEYNGSMSAKVHFCLNRKAQEKLPEAKFSGAAATSGYSAIPAIEADELPFN